MKYPIQRKGRFGRFRRERGDQRPPLRTRLNFRKRTDKPKKPRKPIPRIIVPSFFTLMNLFCGFLAILHIYDGRMELGAWLIVFAGLFDALDGFMARLSNATSEFGIELDSLSDVVSFGAAPGFLMYAASLQELFFLGIMVSALPPLCGAVRLARFNVETKISESNDDCFRGLPIPAQALMLTAIYLTFHDQLELFEHLEYGFNSVLIPTTILLSFLMVSTVPFDKIPRFEKGSIKRNKTRYLFFLAYGITIILFQEYGLIAVFLVFITRGLWQSGKNLFFTIMNGDEELSAVPESEEK